MFDSETHVMRLRNELQANVENMEGEKGKRNRTFANILAVYHMVIFALEQRDEFFLKKTPASIEIKEFREISREIYNLAYRVYKIFEEKIFNEKMDY